MRVMNFKQGEGKTTFMMWWLQQNENAVLLTKTIQSEKMFKEMCPHEADRIICYRNLKGSKLDNDAKYLYGIDDFDNLVKELIGVPLDVVTMTYLKSY